MFIILTVVLPVLLKTKKMLHRQVPDSPVHTLSFDSLRLIQSLVFTISCIKKCSYTMSSNGNGPLRLRGELQNPRLWRYLNVVVGHCQSMEPANATMDELRSRVPSLSSSGSKATLVGPFVFARLAVYRYHAFVPFVVDISPQKLLHDKHYQLSSTYYALWLPSSESSYSSRMKDGLSLSFDAGTKR